eukprot:TRINITY_DN29896_c0_g1_i1.p1 TRINITY_DN29896_c0_g1~~TRINITY_DN29896_c0_g1_i1.p1  ORF type:complete len:214 (-),score=61.79 TRINITY_DN29896_c0_g1_i1:67-708(-)
MLSYIFTILLFTCLTRLTSAESSCQHPESPKESKCEGCPPMFNGKPCASTTWYNDLTKGACGCGNEPNPPDFWTKSKYTAAGNAMMIDPGNPTNSWCVSNCGLCFELCTTGGTHNGEPATPGECIVVQLENRCSDGYGEASNYLCGQNMSPWDCVADPGTCHGMKNTNMYGYPAHFDLQNAALQITEGLGWHNPEVTWEQVDCSRGGLRGLGC